MPRKIAKSRKPGKEARPTSGKVLLALLSILNASGRISGARALDLFSGTGRVALALLERGAASVVAVESERGRARLIEDALRTQGAEARCICGDVRRILPRAARGGERFDVVFADPPYSLGWGEKLIALMRDNWGILAEDGVFIFEHSIREELPPLDTGGFADREDRAYGDTVLTFYWNGGRKI